MDIKIASAIKEILAETEEIVKTDGVAKAGLTMANLESLKQIVKDGYCNEQLNTIVTSVDIVNRIRNEKIADVWFNADSIRVLKEYVSHGGDTPNSAKTIDTGEPKSKSISASFRASAIDGVVLLSGNGVAIYREKLQLPSVIWCHSAEESKGLYEEIKKSIS